MTVYTGKVNLYHYGNDSVDSFLHTTMKGYVIVVYHTNHHHHHHSAAAEQANTYQYIAQKFSYSYLSTNLIFPELVNKGLA